jgi:hypothetical protein
MSLLLRVQYFLLLSSHWKISQQDHIVQQYKLDVNGEGNAYKTVYAAHIHFILQQHESKRPFGRLWCRSIKIDLAEAECGLNSTASGMSLVKRSFEHWQ